MLYRNLSTYFREKYGQRLSKICIDGGFACPNRDGKCGTGGCIYCGERGAGEHIDKRKSIREQVESAIKGKDAGELFVAYFQNFSNTYAKLEVLKEKYDSALIDERIRVLAIATRPDCITEDICELIASYKDRVDVWVELGLQSALDRTAEVINRGYGIRVFDEAVKLLKKHGIDFVVHMIVGLPGETREDAIYTAEYIKSKEPFGIKIHSIYVMQGTKLCDMYLEKRYTPPTLSEYADTVAHIIAHLGKNIVIHRITGDCPRDLLVAPEWNRDKNAIIAAINDRMQKLNLSQGSMA